MLDVFSIRNCIQYFMCDLSDIYDKMGKNINLAKYQYHQQCTK